MVSEMYDQLQEQLSELFGLTLYEARAYTALLLDNSPTTRYDLAKKARIPSPKIYETIQKLYEKGLVFQTADEVPLVIGLDSDILLERLRKRQEQSFVQLNALLSEVKQERSENNMQYIWSFTGVQSAYDKASEIIGRCCESLHIAMFKEDAAVLRESLLRSVSLGVSAKAVIYGKTAFHIEGLEMVEHGEVEGVIKRTGGRWLALTADHNEVLISYPMDGECESLWIKSPVLALMISKYVQEHFYTERPISFDFHSREIQKADTFKADVKE